MGGDGYAKMGSKLQIEPPEEITEEALAEALERFDTVQGHLTCGVESCAVRCPQALA